MKKIKERIEHLEMNRNGLYRINGAYIKVVNLQKRKNKYVVDIILSNDIEQTYERYNKVEYDKKLIGEAL